MSSHIHDFTNIKITSELSTGASASVVVRRGDSAVLCTVQVGEWDFSPYSHLPLEVVYEERFFSVGKIPGGFFKRESKTDFEALMSRLIDRAIRPTISETYRFGLQVICTVLDYDSGDSTEVLSIIGASLALKLAGVDCSLVVASKISFEGGKWLPGATEKAEHTVTFAQSGNGSITMLDTFGKPLNEKIIFDGILAKEKEIMKLLSLSYEYLHANKSKVDYNIPYVEDKNINVDTNEIIHKLSNGGSLESSKDKFVSQWENKNLGELKWNKIVRAVARKKIVLTGKRFDDRSLNSMRKMEFKTNLFSKHGSALYSKGGTSVLSNITFGNVQDSQLVESLSGISKDKFLFQYKFNPYACGEIRKISLSRREIGHGNLAKRAIQSLISGDKVIRIVADVLKSDGSSSMGSVCASYMALRDAGINIEPVAGISMGLIVDGYSTKFLMDITAQEDAWGDMDFKIAGTEGGVTSVQMDLKVSSISLNLLQDAMILGMSGVRKIINSYPKFLMNQNSAQNNKVDQVENIGEVNNDLSKSGVVDKLSEQVSVVKPAKNNNVKSETSSKQKTKNDKLAKHAKSEKVIEPQANKPVVTGKAKLSEGFKLGIKFAIAENLIPELIGAKGATIKNIVKLSGADVDIDKQSATVTIQAEAVGQVDKALASIKKVVKFDKLDFVRVVEKSDDRIFVKTLGKRKKLVKVSKDINLNINDYIQCSVNKLGRLAFIKIINLV
ncbi:MAG: hypothetical protein H6845_01555 [Alphaproteobacteria bacterium]|nr:MAG: hypothetical protein H6845_01555 [Alphaproteobacteria bacterium]